MDLPRQLVAHDHGLPAPGKSRDSNASQETNQNPHFQHEQMGTGKSLERALRDSWGPHTQEETFCLCRVADMFKFRSGDMNVSVRFEKPK